MVRKDETRRKEEEWFLAKERKLLQEIKKKRDDRMKEVVQKEEAERREALKKAHWMHCPKCGHDMDTRNLDTVTVEVCPHCEGVYLDRDELEELIAKRLESRRTIIGKLLGIT